MAKYIIIFGLFFCSCVVYHIDKKEFCRQLSEANIYYLKKNKKDSVPFSTFESIVCYDKKNNKYTIPHCPEVRIYFNKKNKIDVVICKLLLQENKIILLPVEENENFEFIGIDSITYIKVYENLFENLFR
ncbi:MAG: hypothetical protein AB1304_09190 [Bacteroidota bacterium]